MDQQPRYRRGRSSGHPPAGQAPWEPLARALTAYGNGAAAASVVAHNDLGPPTTLPVDLFFRDLSEPTGIESAALHACVGRVLEVGSTAGAVALALQEQGLVVTALDPLPEAVAAMERRGVRDPRLGDIFGFQDPAPFDTVLLLMNGSMVAGTLSGLTRLLERLDGLLNPGGRILMDSTDLREDGRTETEDGRYVGELHYQLEFEGERGPPFPQLFVDPDTLDALAGRVGFVTEVLARGPEGAYLARLERRDPTG